MKDSSCPKGKSKAWRNTLAVPAGEGTIDVNQSRIVLFDREGFLRDAWRNFATGSRSWE